MLHPSVQVNPNAILVSQRQKGNPMLQHIRNVRYQFADIIPDYQMGQQTCALFLSLRWALHCCLIAVQLATVGPFSVLL